jgi:acetone carboxylase alpha subunit
VHYGLTSARVAQKVYGVVLDAQSGEVDEAATTERRAAIRRERLARGRPTSAYIAEQRQRILAGQVAGPSRQSLNECLAGSEKFRRQFIACWGLPEDFRQIPVPTAQEGAA